jgi:hypothetical protein
MPILCDFNFTPPPSFLYGGFLRNREIYDGVGYVLCVGLSCVVSWNSSRSIGVFLPNPETKSCDRVRSEPITEPPAINNYIFSSLNYYISFMTMFIVVPVFLVVVTMFLVVDQTPTTNTIPNTKHKLCS